ncbi:MULTISPECIES: hypothetical protein [Vibrio]|uniref:hypothetical protein n=1 Tax=Vibrio TaxID=662 RepID=UPI002074CA07|nr:MULTISPECIES: hypothetical protein [Vibrio]USD56356.1 hypothetical protein J4N44_07995 [Vibrio sp. SCSIO 43155]
MNNIDRAVALYLEHIYDRNKIELLRSHGLKIAGSVPSVMWELFGSVLTGRNSIGVTGADLQGWEVKSVKQGGSYEYQYHLNTGAQKLDEDCEVNHLFCSYSPTYENVVVRVMTGEDLRSKFFDIWRPQYAANYNSSVPAAQRRQRFRKNIPFGYVENNGILVLEITNGTLTYRNDEVIPRLNR